MPPTCSQCGGSGYGPPDMRYDGTEREPHPCEHCKGSGAEPVWKPSGSVKLAPIGTDPDDHASFKEVGYVSEDGYDFQTGGHTTGQPWSDPEYDTGQDFTRISSVTHTIPIKSFDPGIMDILKAWNEAPEPVAVDFLQILDKARAYRQAEAQKELLKERLNLRWRYHRHPDARKLVLDYEGRRKTYPHAFVTKNDTGFDVDPQPIPALDDPDYYLRNP